MLRRAASRRTTRGRPGRRCSTIGVTCAAPAAAICRTVASSWAGESDRNGTTGPISTPQRSPRSLSAAHASSRRAGLGCPARWTATASLSTKPADTFSPTSVTSAACGQQVEVAQDQRALGQDRERVGGVAQRGDDAGHQPVAPLGPLVAVDVGAHRDVLARPARRGQLLAHQLRRVDLDHDLGVEVVPGVQVQVGVRVPGEAVVAHHAVGDEVAGAGGDVVHRQVQARAARSPRPAAWRRS